MLWPCNYTTRGSRRTFARTDIARHIKVFFILHSKISLHIYFIVCWFFLSLWGYTFCLWPFDWTWGYKLILFSEDAKCDYNLQWNVCNSRKKCEHVACLIRFSEEDSNGKTVFHMPLKCCPNHRPSSLFSYTTSSAALEDQTLYDSNPSKGMSGFQRYK